MAVQVLSLEGHLEDAGMSQNVIADKFAALQANFQDQLDAAQVCMRNCKIPQDERIKLTPTYEALPWLHLTENDVQVELSKTRQALRQAEAQKQDANLVAAEREAKLAEKTRLADEASQFREQALHHARFRDEALREGEDLRRLNNQLEFDKLGLETLLDRTRNELEMCEKHNFLLTESLTAQRVATTELSSEVDYLRRMQDRTKSTAASRMLAKWSKFMLARPFEKWAENAAEFREWRMKGRKAVMRMVMFCASRAFFQWLENHEASLMSTLEKIA